MKAAAETRSWRSKSNKEQSLEHNAMMAKITEDHKIAVANMTEEYETATANMTKDHNSTTTKLKEKADKLQDKV